MTKVLTTTACLLLSLCLILSACSSLPLSDPIPPEVSVDRFRLGKLSLRKQEVHLRLKVDNPNNFQLPLQVLTFNVNVEGVELANGSSDQAVTIPANGDALLDVSVSSSRLFKFVFDYLAGVSKGKTETEYTVAGFVKLSNWPQRIPFDVDGVFDTPEELIDRAEN